MAVGMVYTRPHNIRERKRFAKGETPDPDITRLYMARLHWGLLRVAKNMPPETPEQKLDLDQWEHDLLVKKVNRFKRAQWRANREAERLV